LKQKHANAKFFTHTHINIVSYDTYLDISIHSPFKIKILFQEG